MRCGKCGIEFDGLTGLTPEERMPCPTCGSVDGRVELLLESGVTVSSSLALKATDRFGKWFSKQRIGDSYHRLTGWWHRLERVIDRRRNRYREHIEDTESGALVRHVGEHLTDHTGRGDARGR